MSYRTQSKTYQNCNGKKQPFYLNRNSHKLKNGGLYYLFYGKPKLFCVSIRIFPYLSSSFFDCLYDPSFPYIRMVLVSMTELMPREKLLSYGVESLTDAELLALFLRTGYKGVNVLELSKHLLDEFGSLYHLISAPVDDFCNTRGLGKAKYTQLKAVVELSQRYLTIKMSLSDSLVSPSITHHYLASRLAHKEREVFLVIFLDNQNRVLYSEEMFVGTYNCVEVHPREIVREALKCNAAALILAHNHPSGISEPSQADRNITQQIEQACDLLDIRVLDHIVIGKGEYVSFAERGWI